MPSYPSFAESLAEIYVPFVREAGATSADPTDALGNNQAHLERTR
jgi:hypothetical protein